MTSKLTRLDCILNIYIDMNSTKKKSYLKIYVLRIGYDKKHYLDFEIAEIQIMPKSKYIGQIQTYNKLSEINIRKISLNLQCDLFTRRGQIIILIIPLSFGNSFSYTCKHLLMPTKIKQNKRFLFIFFSFLEIYLNLLEIINGITKLNTARFL